jgi:hypothetical protein
MSKPIAKVVVLAAGPTHCLGLPVAGPKTLIPGSSLLVYDVADLEAIKRAVPASQLKIREFPRILDQAPVIEKEQKVPAKSGKQGKRGR